MDEEKSGSAISFENTEANPTSVRVLSSEFVLGVHSPDQIPTDGLGEIAFVGRSNVGKSSLLNAVCGRRALARVSKTPGRTQAINFFRATLGCTSAQDSPHSQDPEEHRKECYMVDLPGFGHAKVSKAMRKDWARLLEGYLMESPHLKAVILLNDARREPREEELWFQQALGNELLIPVLTKVDKLSRSALDKSIRQHARMYDLDKSVIVPISVLGGERRGIPELLSAVYQVL